MLYPDHSQASKDVRRCTARQLVVYAGHRTAKAALLQLGMLLRQAGACRNAERLIPSRSSVAAAGNGCKERNMDAQCKQQGKRAI